MVNELHCFGLRTGRTSVRFAGAAAAGVIMAWTASETRAAEWPVYLGPNGDGTTSERVGASAPTLAWRKDVGMGISAVSAAGWRAFTMGNIDNETIVYCLDPESGNEIWTHRFFSPAKKDNYEGGRTPFPGGPTGTPAVHGGRVYTLSRFGRADCLDAETGDVIWTVEFENDFPDFTQPRWGYAASPFVSGDRVYLEPGGTGQSIACLDARTGKIIWKGGDDPAGYATPQIAEIDGKRTLVLFNEFGLVGRDPESGDEFWRLRWETKYGVNAAVPTIVDGNHIFLSSGYGTGCGLVRIADGNARALWTNRNMQNKHTVSIRVGGHVFGFDETILACVDLTTGEKIWEQDGLGRGALIRAGDKFLVQSEDGRLIVAEMSADDGFKPLTEVPLFSEAHCWTIPTLSNGRIFCRDVEGRLACLTAAPAE